MSVIVWQHLEILPASIPATLFGHQLLDEIMAGWEYRFTGDLALWVRKSHTKKTLISVFPVKTIHQRNGTWLFPGWVPSTRFMLKAQPWARNQSLVDKASDSVLVNLTNDLEPPLRCILACRPTSSTIVVRDEKVWPTAWLPME